MVDSFAETGFCLRMVLIICTGVATVKAIEWMGLIVFNDVAGLAGHNLVATVAHAGHPRSALPRLC
jgi:hypothetical protein